MTAMREKDQADFDLERFIDMFDEALTSRDERVVNALRSLMMMVILTKPESRNNMSQDREAGPLRRMQQDINHLSRRLYDLEENLRREAAYEQELNSRLAQRNWDPEKEKYLLEANKVAMNQISGAMSKNLAHKINSPGLLKK